MPDYSIEEHSTLGSKDYQIFLKHNGAIISPFHDVDLYITKDIVNMIVEIPKNTHYKLEIFKKIPMNPIKHDIKRNDIRIIELPYPANYGSLPQTWENPDFLDLDTNTYGDNDPIDVFDISDIPSATGSVIQVKVLGVYGMIDANETDWKIIGINILDPKACELNDITDVDECVLRNIFVFLRDYKLPYDKQPTFAFDNKPLNKEKALQIISLAHEEWKNEFMIM